jgi:hypothetical protein
VKKIFINVVVFTFAFCAGAQANLSDEAQALFTKGEYIQGRNVLTKALNDPDPAQRASAMLVYARFYDNIVGNTDYAFNFYNDIGRMNLPENDPVKSAALKETNRIKDLKIQYKTEDAFLKKLKPAELAGEHERFEIIAQLLSITQHKPDYYRLSEVYYQLGRYYFAINDFHKAYPALKKSLELKPGINVYLPVGTWKDKAYDKLIRADFHTASWGILGALLVLTAIAFYSARPWQWLKLRHLMIGIAMVVMWIVVYLILYTLVAARPGGSEKTMFQANVIPPYFFSFGLDNPFWTVAKDLFLYGLVGTFGLFIFSVAISRLRCRWVSLMINFAFAILLFGSLVTVFYMRDCDQKSLFGSEGSGAFYYLAGDNYFVNVGIEPYVLTNPRAYPNLAISNVADPYMNAWLRKYCVLDNKPPN